MAAYRWVDDLTVTCGLTACTPGSAPGPTLGIEYGKPSPLSFRCKYAATGTMFMIEIFGRQIWATDPQPQPNLQPYCCPNVCTPNIALFDGSVTERAVKAKFNYAIQLVR